MLSEKLEKLAVDPEKILKCGSLAKLPFKDMSFDAVISFRIVSHVPDWELFLGELCRVSRNRVIIDFAPGACRALKKMLFLIKGRFETASREFTTQSVIEITRAAASAGFCVKAVEREFIMPMVLHRLSRGMLLGVEKAAVRLGLTRFFGGPAVALLERKLES